MANAKQYTRVKFQIHGVDLTNEDGKERQELLKEFLYNDVNQLTFNRVGQPTKEKHQTIEAMVNGQKIGEISDSDYVEYQTNIMIAKDARVAIYEEELENGESYFTADACLYVPYVQTKESRMKYVNRKKKTIVAMGIIFIALAIWQFVQGEVKIGIFGVVMALLMGYWGLIRKPEEDDKVLYYLKTGKKKRIVGK